MNNHILGEGRAPGKVILFGDHAVVYGQPAIAVPVARIEASAAIHPLEDGDDWQLAAETLAGMVPLNDLAIDHPLAAILRRSLEWIGETIKPGLLRINSTIPIASGLGSGAAVSVAIVRAIANYSQKQINDEEVSKLVYEVEKIHHGNPSGIDNTVIAYRSPVYFQRDKPIELLNVVHPFHLAIADTGIASATRLTVSGVRERYEASPLEYSTYFERMGSISSEARKSIVDGMTQSLGSRMNENHGLLKSIGVSCMEIDRLVDAAREAGAAGAKLSGAGLGGNVIAIVEEHSAEKVKQSLSKAGAKRVILTMVDGEES